MTEIPACFQKISHVGCPFSMDPWVWVEICRYIQFEFAIQHIRGGGSVDAL